MIGGASDKQSRFTTGTEKAMKMSDTITVVIPLYNKRPHIARALNSIAAQTVRPDEIIVIDDNSSDGGLEELLAFPELNIRILKRTTPGPGGYAARNLGIVEATSTWIAFLDADDSWMPDAIEQTRRSFPFASTATALFSGYMRNYGEKIEVPPRFTPETPPQVLEFEAFLKSWLRRKQCPMWTSAVTARRAALIEVEMFPAGKCERGGDKDTWLRLASRGQVILNSRVTAVYHRDAVNMVTKSTKANRRPYICETIEALLNGAVIDKRLLKSLFNLEMYTRAKEALRSNLAIDRAFYRGFFVFENPIKFFVILGIVHLPRPLLHGFSFLTKSPRKKKYE